ncbi:hypothetical protein [Arthrobacter sp. efr-133-R2A-63]|uniref:hypothetical protein n=1 Tax=Arthrobacter sp. efr-133-R2A-63 TaxID=3040278 RepID=UPI00254EDB25|nr:hypothetical protein [Arthrobacter sp. efr-133-R2A-63]
MPAVPLADAEYAAMTFAAHLDSFWASGRPESWGWSYTKLDPLHACIHAAAVSPDGSVDDYCILLDARSYDELPPGVYFVSPADPRGPKPQPGSPWLPSYTNVPFGFAIHPSFSYPDGSADQLVCFSQSRDYYISNHTPFPGEKWQPGTHTLAATLSRLHEVLTPPCYLGRAGALDS